MFFFLLCDVCFKVYSQICMTVNSSITPGRQAISLYHQSSTLSDWTLNKLFRVSLNKTDFRLWEIVMVTWQKHFKSSISDTNEHRICSIRVLYYNVHINIGPSNSKCWSVYIWLIHACMQQHSGSCKINRFAFCNNYEGSRLGWMDGSKHQFFHVYSSSSASWWTQTQFNS